MKDTSSMQRHNVEEKICAIIRDLTAVVIELKEKVAQQEERIKALEKKAEGGKKARAAQGQDKAKDFLQDPKVALVYNGLKEGLTTRQISMRHNLHFGEVEVIANILRQQQRSVSQ